jgi:hypothetical protein
VVCALLEIGSTHNLRSSMPAGGSHPPRWKMLKVVYRREFGGDVSAPVFGGTRRRSAGRSSSGS